MIRIALMILILLGPALARADEPPKLDEDSEAVVASLRRGETAILCVHATPATGLTREFNRKLNLIRRRVRSANAEHVTSSVDLSSRPARSTLCAVISRAAEEDEPNFVRFAHPRRAWY